MAYRELTGRESRVLHGLTGDLLPDYVRMLSRAGVRYRDIGQALGVTESTVADIAADGRPPIAGQRLPDGFAGYLRSLRRERDPDLNPTLALAIQCGWTYTALAAALGISATAVRNRARNGGQITPARAREVYVPVPPQRDGSPPPVRRRRNRRPATPTTPTKEQPFLPRDAASLFRHLAHLTLESL